MSAKDDLVARRLAALSAPHLAGLERYRTGLARNHGEVPHFDPFDGGDRARCLLLLETPGPRAGAIRFVSRDNATGTARNIARFCSLAGLDRGAMVIWNTVPWLLHRTGERNRAPRRDEIAAGIAELPALLDLLPSLRVVVLSGRVAGLAEATVRRTKPRLAVLKMPHPSPIYVNTAPTIADRLRAALAQAVSCLEAASDCEQSPA